MSDLRMPDTNMVLIAGNLTRDPSFRKTTNGTSVTNFWIASNRKFKDNTGQWRENVCYVGVVAWYKLAETCADNLSKGCAVLVEGELQSRSVRSEDGRNRNIVEIKARRVQFLNKRDDAIENDGAESMTSSKEEKSAESVKKDAPKVSDDKEEDVEVKKEIESKEEEKDNPMKGKFDYGYENIEL